MTADLTHFEICNAKASVGPDGRAAVGKEIGVGHFCVGRQPAGRYVAWWHPVASKTVTCPRCGSKVGLGALVVQEKARRAKG